MRSERKDADGKSKKLLVVDPAVRIDQWLVAARVFKTRRMAADACRAGKVRVDGGRVSAHRLVRPGSKIEVNAPRGRLVLLVNALAHKRLPAALAKDLYTDRSPPRPATALENLHPPGYREPGSGRPTKRERRAIERLRRS